MIDEKFGSDSDVIHTNLESLELQNS